MKRIAILILALAAFSLPAAASPSVASEDTVASPHQTVQHTRANNDSVATPAGHGTLMWVPDSLAASFRSVIDGRSKIVRDDSRIDLTEKVVVRGDTVPLIIKQKNLGRFDRGLFNFLFIPKGQWQFALTASYGEFKSDDLRLFDLLSDVDVNGNIFSIKPSISYFVRNNISVGLRLNYTRAKAGVGSLNLDVDDDMSFELSDIHYNNEEYSATITCAQYLGITRGSRLGIFNEVALSFASGNGQFVRPYGGEPKDTRTTYMEARLSFSPGICVFVMKNVSFNVSFGVFGYYLRNEKQTVNGEKLGNRFSSGANFKFNIFNINFGIGVHI